jgi:putative transposase
MIDRDHKLPVTQQAKLLKLSRGSVYYLPKPVSAADLALMRRMGIEAIAPQPGTSKATPGNKIYPYLLRKLAIVRSNQVWALDTTYIPMARGFVYLTAVVDVASRRVLTHKVAITLEACHAVEIIEEAFARFGPPEIGNTDQGSEFTASDFTDAVLNKGCKLSMDGRGAWRDNFFVERVWRSAKYERIYLKAYDGVAAARVDIADYFTWYVVVKLFRTVR